MAGRWVVIDGGEVPLRCWWANPNKGNQKVVLVLPEVFGINSWVRSVVDRLEEKGIASLAMPLFARTAPELDLGYSENDLIEGRRHKELTTTDQILADTSSAIQWLREQNQESKIIVIGFCFGGHAALITSTLPEVSATFDFYGAGVSISRPGGGPPSLELLPTVSGELTCLCGTSDPLIPASDRTAIQEALRKEDPDGNRMTYIEVESADHGFMCEQRASFNADASELGWGLLLEKLNA